MEFLSHSKSSESTALLYMILKFHSLYSLFASVCSALLLFYILHLPLLFFSLSLFSILLASELQRHLNNIVYLYCYISVCVLYKLACTENMQIVGNKHIVILPCRILDILFVYCIPVLWLAKFPLCWSASEMLTWLQL